MRLSDCSVGGDYKIISADVSGKTLRHLDSLGLVIGENIHVLSSGYAGIIAEVKGSRLAIGQSVARKMQVADPSQHCHHGHDHQKDELGPRGFGPHGKASKDGRGFGADNERGTGRADEHAHGRAHENAHGHNQAHGQRGGDAS